MPPKKKSKEVHKEPEAEMEVDAELQQEPSTESLQMPNVSRGFHPEGACFVFLEWRGGWG